MEEPLFNKSSRKRNAALSAISGMGSSFIERFAGFVYRTLFIYFLSSEYVGLNGLFTNIFQILSLTELGISQAIIYRFYKPISEGDVEKVGQLMNFYRVIYRIIAMTIFGLGLLLMPFLNFLIADESQVPSDVNLYVVYFLFLLNTVSTYTFTYRHAILLADQKGYLKSALQAPLMVCRYGVQILMLFFYRDFILCLVTGMVVAILFDIAVSGWVTHRYKPVFDVKTGITREERKAIFSDTKATMFHRIGGTVLNSSDSIVLSKYISLIAAGLYSNYFMILSAISMILKQFLGSFTSSIGNSQLQNTKERNYAIYKELLFVNFFLAGAATTGIFASINDFILLWIGKEYAFDSATCAMLAVMFFLENIRIVTTSFTEATGLFVKDRYRSLIEAGINLVVSILLTIKIGIAGVFIGTVISHLCTVTWREPYLLYRDIFRENIMDYVKLFCSNAVITLAASFLMVTMKHSLGMVCSSWISWCVEGLLSVCIYGVLFLLWFYRTEEFRKMLDLAKSLVLKITRRSQ